MSNSDNNKSSAPKITPMMAAFVDSESVIRKFLRRFTSNHHDIEDYTQETILRALKAEQNNTIDEPRAYLFGIAKNVARRDIARKSKNIIGFIEDLAAKEYVSNEPSLEESIGERERMTIFAHAVASLPAQCQKVFILKKVYGYSHKEISKKMGISTSTTEKHVATGLKKCNKFIDVRMRDVTKASLSSDVKKELGVSFAND